MTLAPPLPIAPDGSAVAIGQVVGVLERPGAGGEVFVRGELTFAWTAGDVAGRRLAAVLLARTRAAMARDVAAGFGVDEESLRRWGVAYARDGVAGLLPGRTGPKGPSKVHPDVVAEIRERRGRGASLAGIAMATGVSVTSVRRALAESDAPGEAATSQSAPTRQNAVAPVGDAGEVPAAVLPVLGAPVPRTGERAAAWAGLLTHAEPVFTPCSRVPLAGLFLALPALEATGLLGCANAVFGALPAGFYGLDTTLLEWVGRVLAGQPRAEGATRVDPVDLGRFLGMDRAPEVKTIRRKLAHLAAAGKGAELLEAMAAHLLSRENEQDQECPFLLYVDGHVRAYHGKQKVAKTHLARTRFPAPATLETWVSDGRGDPVLVVMAQPGASLAAELRRLVPTLRAAVGDDRRVLVGFDRGGWSPTLFKDLDAAGFDVLTWRKGPAPDQPAAAFTQVTHTTADGLTRSWELADTMVDLPLTETKDAPTFRIRQVTRLDTKKGRTRQVHVLTTRTDLDAGEVIYRIGMRWRQENHFRYARMRFDLDSHDSYDHDTDDPTRSVPNPAKAATRADVNAARAHLERARARADADLLALRSPRPGTEGVLITNAMLEHLTADVRAAETDLKRAQQVNKATPTRLPLAQVNPGQQVLETQTKLITHAVKIAAYRTTTALARDIRLTTGYARAAHEAHTLARQILTHTGDIHPEPGQLTIRLDPLPTARATRTAKQLCEHLTATRTTYPGTQTVIRYEVKPRP